MEKVSLGPRKILRAPALRRGREVVPITERVKLERVLGLTVSSNASLDCDPQTGVVAYPAGCVIVLYNIRKNKQSHILSASKKTITSLALSWDGKYLATGECGHQPHVRVWDVQEKVQVGEFQVHKYGINCVAFSPNLKYVVSVGSQHDMIVNVWDWRNDVKVASNKVSCKVKAISFASSGNYFVTVGNRHVKFWYLEYSRSSKYKLEPVPLMGRSAILGDQRNNYFCDVACGRSEMTDSTYAITKSGLLCEFNSRRLLDKWVELRTTGANSISVGEEYIFVGCAEGVVRCFSPYNLHFLCTLPRPHYLGVDVAKGLIGSRHMTSHPSSAKYPDTIAIALDETNKKVTCIYNDHSMYVWDVKDNKKVGKSHSFLYHSACIWGVETYPILPEKLKHILPEGTFLTCSSDDTIRIWNLEPNIAQDTPYHRNIYSSELLKILYVDPDLAYLCDVDFNPSGSNDKVDATYDGKNGVRCLRISPDGNHLASGDRSGNIRIFDLEYVEELCKVEAHDAEVLCLEYSKPIIYDGAEKRCLASASRDRLIHVFDVNQDSYSLQQTLDDHSSSITAVRFVHTDNQLQMLSCGADKSIIFRRLQFTPQFNLVREHHVVGKTTLYDMEVDIQQRYILTACQDRNIRVYAVSNGKHSRCFRGSQGEDGTLIKVVLDPSGTYIASSCTDKSLYIYDYYTGECLATMFGHSELVTGLAFTYNGKHLISVSGDGCIFLWRLPVDLTQTITNRQTNLESLPVLWRDGKKGAVAVTKPLQIIEREEDQNISEQGDQNNAQVNLRNERNEETPGYRFSMGQLPLWAKKQMLEELSPTSLNSEHQQAVPSQPRGRWAQRIDGQGLVLRSYLESDSVIPFPTVQNQLQDSLSHTETDFKADTTDDSLNFKNDSSEMKNGLEDFKENSDDFKDDSVSFRNDDNVQEFYDAAEQENNDIEFEVSVDSLREIQSGNFQQIGGGRITYRRCGEGTLSPGSVKGNSRVRHSTDSSSTSSMKLEDVDAEDERSDTEAIEGSETVYYPPSEDGSEIGDGTFCVCATNEDELRDARRKLRKSKFPDIPAISTPEQGETNSDDEEVGTPLDGDRSFLSAFSISTENLERLGQREKFMKSNYESLEKDMNEEKLDNEPEERNFPRSSISAKFLARSLVSPSLRSNKVISGKQQTLSPKIQAPSKKREELNKALIEARRKLETLSYRGGSGGSLSSSKSVGDLHSIPDSHPIKKLRHFKIGDGEIRRTSSLIDLSAPMSPQHRNLPTVPSRHISAPLWSQARIKSEEPPSVPVKPTVPHSSAINSPAHERLRNGNISRSASLSSLQVGEQRMSLSPVHKAPSVYTLARVTGSPRKPSSVISNSPVSKCLSSSSVNNIGRTGLSVLPNRRQPLAPLEIQPHSADSSSDASPTEPNLALTGVIQNHTSGRERSFSIGNCAESNGPLKDGDIYVLSSVNRSRNCDRSKSRSEWDLRNSGSSSPWKSKFGSRDLTPEPRKGLITLEKMSRSDSRSRLQVKGTRLIANSQDNLFNNDNNYSFLPEDATAVPLSQELCENVAEQLRMVTNYAMTIFQRVTMDSELPPIEKTAMTTALAQGVWQAQQNLRPAVPPMPVWSTESSRIAPSPSTSSDFLPSSFIKRDGADTQPELIQGLLQQFSDKLLSIVEQQISKSQVKPNN